MSLTFVDLQQLPIQTGVANGAVVMRNTHNN